MKAWCFCLLLAVPSVVSAQEVAFDLKPNVFETGDAYIAPTGLTTAELFINGTTVPEAPAALSILTIGPGANVPEHVHDGSAELLFILEGGGTMTVAGVAQAVSTGSAIYIPAATPHSYTNDAVEMTRAVQVYVGAGPEARFRNWAPVEE